MPGFRDAGVLPGREVFSNPVASRLGNGKQENRNQCQRIAKDLIQPVQIQNKAHSLRSNGRRGMEPHQSHQNTSEPLTKGPSQLLSEDDKGADDVRLPRAVVERGPVHTLRYPGKMDAPYGDAPM